MDRHFDPPAPDRLWVLDFTYCSTWSGMVYVAFVIDAYSGRILGWRSARHVRTRLVLDALEHALSPRRGGDPLGRLLGDAFDTALAETTIGLFKTELFKRRGPWRTAEQVEIAVLELVDWYNHRRRHEHCGDIPPVEMEQPTTVCSPSSPRPGAPTN